MGQNKFVGKSLLLSESNDGASFHSASIYGNRMHQPIWEKVAESNLSFIFSFRIQIFINRVYKTIFIGRTGLNYLKGIDNYGLIMCFDTVVVNNFIGCLISCELIHSTLWFYDF